MGFFLIFLFFFFGGGGEEQRVNKINKMLFHTRSILAEKKTTRCPVEASSAELLEESFYIRRVCDLFLLCSVLNE